MDQGIVHTIRFDLNWKKNGTELLPSMNRKTKMDLLYQSGRKMAEVISKKNFKILKFEKFWKIDRKQKLISLEFEFVED